MEYGQKRPGSVLRGERLMSGIPSDIAGSALQAGFVQREASRTAEAARAGQVHATERQLRAVDEAAGNVETTDDDTQVYADSEGTGGQGRMFSEEEEENEGGERLDQSPDAPDGPTHLDIQA